jgi:sugar phosphate permease
MPVLIGVSAGTSANLLTKIGPRPLLTVGPILSGLGLLMLGLRLEPHSSYVSVILPSIALVALGMGAAFVSLTSSAVAGVPQEDAGIASALLNAGQQVGGALGLAILTAVSTTRTTNLLHQFVPTGPNDPRLITALVRGWSLGFVVGAIFLAVAAIVMTSLVRVSKEAAAEALKEGVAA